MNKLKNQIHFCDVLKKSKTILKKINLFTSDGTPLCLKDPNLSESYLSFAIGYVSL
jgi:hypothetical protein